MFDINEYSLQKTEESPLFCDLAPSFHVIFQRIYFLITNGDINKNNWLQKFGEILRKTTDCKSFQNSQGNLYGGVSFSKVISLQYSDWNFAIKRIHHTFFFLFG